MLCLLVIVLSMRILFKSIIYGCVMIQIVHNANVPLQRPRPGDPFDSYPKNFWQEFSSPFTDGPGEYEQYSMETSTAAQLPSFVNGYLAYNISSQLNHNVSLDCQVNNLDGKTVSWMRRKGDALTLITFGKHIYSSDSRYNLKFEQPNNWRLQLQNVQKNDEGSYECQISAHPSLVLEVFLKVIEPHIMILDDRLSAIPEKFYKIGSTIELHCIVNNIFHNSTNVIWKHGQQILNHDTKRGGISVKTDVLSQRISSKLYIANSDSSDSGNYTCIVNAETQVTVTIHILSIEQPAAMQQSASSKLTTTWFWQNVFADDSSKTNNVTLEIIIYITFTLSVTFCKTFIQ